MKQIVFILFIFLIHPFCVHAKKAVFGYSGSYWEGYSLEELNINEYKNNFSGSGKLKLHAYTVSGFGRKKWGFLPELEGRINLEHLAYSIKGVINGKCYTGIGPSILIGGDGFLNLHGGVLYCGPHQSSLYILDTDEPQLNPYDSELIKNYYGVAANFEGERSKWGLRLLYNIQILNLKIFYSNSSSSQEIQSQLYGLEIFYKN